MVDHRIHISRRNKKSQPGFAEHLYAGRITPVRLGNDSHRIAMSLQHPADDCIAERAVIHISIPDNIGEIHLFPSALPHLPTGNRQKLCHRPCPLISVPPYRYLSDSFRLLISSPVSLRLSPSPRDSSSTRAPMDKRFSHNTCFPRAANMRLIW